MGVFNYHTWCKWGTPPTYHVHVYYSYMNALLNYLRDTRGELKHVSWPTQRQTMIYTVLVIAISILTALYIGLLDHLFVKGLEFLLI